MRRTRQNLADLSRDMADLVRTLAERGETVFGVDRMPPPPPPVQPTPEPALAPTSTVEGLPSSTTPPSKDLPRGIKELAGEADTCTLCGLADRRNKVVFGDGTGEAGLMLIGEGPGRNEDETGLPFVGRAGKLLDRMTTAAGFRRRELYITNIVKCRPPRNRDPRPDEIQTCRPYLNRQVEFLKPRVIVAVGRPAAQSLLRTDRSLSRLRGLVHGLAGIPLVVTYHPAYLLRSPAQKARAWEDWRRIRDLLGRVQGDDELPIDGEAVPL